MAIALLGYFTTMITAFFGLMLLLNSVLSSSFLQHTRPRPYPTPVMAEAVVPESETTAQRADAESAGGETISLPMPRPAAADKKSTRMKVARDLRPKEDMAGRQQDREYSMALGYAQERQPGALFDVFGTRRF